MRKPHLLSCREAQEARWEEKEKAPQRWMKGTELLSTLGISAAIIFLVGKTLGYPRCIQIFYATGVFMRHAAIPSFLLVAGVAFIYHGCAKIREEKQARSGDKVPVLAQTSPAPLLASTATPSIAAEVVGDTLPALALPNNGERHFTRDAPPFQLLNMVSRQTSSADSNGLRALAEKLSALAEEIHVQNCQDLAELPMSEEELDMGDTKPQDGAVIVFGDTTRERKRA